MSAVERCRRAFCLNNIPWDAQLARLPEETLLETAEYWEQRASTIEDVPITQLTTIKDIKTRLHKLAGIGGASGALTAIQKAQSQYHGDVNLGRSV